METKDIIQIIIVIIAPFIANFTQEFFRWIQKIKKSKCCGSEIEFNQQAIEKKDSTLNLNKV